MDTITIQKNTFEELNIYKKLVENNLQEDLSAEEISQINKAKKTEIMTKKDFLAKNPELKNV